MRSSRTKGASAPLSSCASCSITPAPSAWRCRRSGARPTATRISLANQPQFPGNLETEQRLIGLVRWNALAMVVRANKFSSELGGHIASYASAADLFEVGFNHFFRAGQSGRSDLLPAALGARHLRARVPRRPAQRRAGGQLPARGRRQRPVVLLPSVPDAGVLAVPDRLHGAGPAQGHLSGALHALSRESRHPRHVGAQGVVLRRRRRDGRAGSAGRPVGGLARGAGQPHFRGELQPAAARRPGARQRLGHPGTGRPVRRRRLERDQAAVGFGLGPAVRARPRERDPQAAARDGRRRIPEVRRHRRAASIASTSSTSTPSCRPSSRTCPTRTSTG